MKKLHDTLYKGIESINLSSLAEPFSHYTSNSRNKLIARAFKEAGLIERYGSGVPRIHKICQEYGIKSPIPDEISQEFRITLFKEKVKLGDSWVIG